MSQEVLVFLTAATPVLELRGAIPLGILVMEMPKTEVYIISALGNLMPVLPLLLFWRYLAGKLTGRVNFLDKARKKWFQRVYDKNFAAFQKLKIFALFLFVAVPLPFTGAWSGTVAAMVFKIPFWQSFWAISAGVLASGLIVLFSLGLVF